VVIHVADNGPGVPDQREHIFNAFSAPKTAAWAWGWPFANSIVEAPRPHRASRDPAGRRPFCRCCPHTHRLPHDTCCHIVDDDPDIRDGLTGCLTPQPPAASWASGPDFLQAIAHLGLRWGHAVVVMDIRMEPLSGLATFEKLRALQCPWPVLFLTGHGDVSMAVSAVKNGAWDFLEKPFQDNQLVDRVEQALAVARAQAQVDEQTRQLKAALQSLSQREHEVLAELLQGHYNKTLPTTWASPSARWSSTGPTSSKNWGELGRRAGPPVGAAARHHNG
jgi:two-component system response regulator DctR